MRARGANALCFGQFEDDYGTPPATDFVRLPFITTQLGEEQGLLEDDMLGTGREPLDPELDVANNVGDHVVPVDVRGFGYWLKLYFGDPVTAGSGHASGSIVFTAQPAVNSTVTINGVVFTAKAAGAAGPQYNIGVDLAATLVALAAVLNGSADASVTPATYASDATTLTITHDAAGLAGNAFTLATSGTAHGTVSGATLTGGTVSHTFSSGAEELPSMSIEIGMPEVPSYGMNFGARGNTMQIAMNRRGKLNCKLGLICQGETIDGASGAGDPDEFAVVRFAQATGQIMKNGVQLASVVEAEVNYTNNSDPVETIRPDGRIEDADPAKSGGTGSVKMRFRDHTMLDLATGRDPCELSFGWSFEQFSLVFTYERIFLPKVKRPIDGPNGILATFPWQASGADGHVTTVVLINDVAEY